jgi:hypothetical protein
MNDFLASKVKTHRYTPWRCFQEHPPTIHGKGHYQKRISIMARHNLLVGIINSPDTLLLDDTFRTINKTKVRLAISSETVSCNMVVNTRTIDDRDTNLPDNLFRISVVFSQLLRILFRELEACRNVVALNSKSKNRSEVCTKPRLPCRYVPYRNDLERSEDERAG